MTEPRITPDWHASWDAPLADTMAGPAMAGLAAFLGAEAAAGKAIFPPRPLWFHALALTPRPAVRVVILGQDPYHGDGQAHGLSFSVPAGVRPPPSLANIFKELHADLGIARPAHGCLAAWAGQGVLLLNSVLTVERGRAGAHRGRGWEALTDRVVQAVAAGAAPCVFLLWGAQAQKKAGLVAAAGGRHRVLAAPHPSPLSAHTGWFGSRPFSQANAFLAAHGRGTVDWALPPIG